MATVVCGELWQRPQLPGLIVVTTNSVVNSRGLLIMGRGSAGDAVKRIPGLQFEVTAEIRQQRPEIVLDGTVDYGFLIIRSPFRPGRVGFGILQAKRHWRHVSAWSTIELALSQLETWAIEHPEVEIRCSLPGAGCGQIGSGTPVDREQLLAACCRLPESITFFWRS